MIFVRHEDGTEGIFRRFGAGSPSAEAGGQKPRVSFERDRAVTNNLKTRVSLLCYLSADGPEVAKEVSLWMRFDWMRAVRMPARQTRAHGRPL